MKQVCKIEKETTAMCNVNPLTTGLVVFLPYGTINSGGSRPSCKGGSVVVSKQNFRAPAWSKHKGETWTPWAPSLDPPLTNINFPSWTNLAFSLR